MAHESFENDATAAIMNREFVNIKVDREERPDVDRVYMTFVQATTGGGGWPMSVWLTPELKPFVGGTYFPPEDRYGHPAFKRVLERIAEAGNRIAKKFRAGDEDHRCVARSAKGQTSAATRLDAQKFWTRPTSNSREAMMRTKAVSAAPRNFRGRSRSIF